jgi:hypothetical protein
VRISSALRLLVFFGQNKSGRKISRFICSNCKIS